MESKPGQQVAPTTAMEAGPELPPGFDDLPADDRQQPAAPQGPIFVENKDQSELKQSINKKGGNSYYYAHNYSGQNFNDELAKKVYGDGIIHGGDPVLVAKNETKKDAAVEHTGQLQKKKIKTFAWNDEDKKIKIYIDLAQFDTPITKEMAEINFSEYALNILVVDQNGVNNILDFSPLYEKIEVDKSSWRINEKRITIVLKKWLDTKWFDLLKKKSDKD